MNLFAGLGTLQHMHHFVASIHARPDFVLAQEQDGIVDIADDAAIDQMELGREVERAARTLFGLCGRFPQARCDVPFGGSKIRPGITNLLLCIVHGLLSFLPATPNPVPAAMFRTVAAPESLSFAMSSRAQPDLPRKMIRAGFAPPGASPARVRVVQCAAAMGGAVAFRYFGACALSAAMSASLRSVMTNIWCDRYVGMTTLVTPSRSCTEMWRLSVPRTGISNVVHFAAVGS